MFFALSVIGPTACGKGTQAKHLMNDHFARVNELELFTTSELLKAHAAAGGMHAREINACQKEGRLVSDETTMKVILEALFRRNKQRSFILDGSPRTKVQHTSLRNFLDEMGFSKMVILNMKFYTGHEQNDRDMDNMLVSRAKKRLVVSGDRLEDPHKIEEITRKRLAEYREKMPELLKQIHEDIHGSAGFVHWIDVFCGFSGEAHVQVAIKEKINAVLYPKHSIQAGAR